VCWVAAHVAGLELQEELLVLLPVNLPCRTRRAQRPKFNGWGQIQANRLRRAKGCNQKATDQSSQLKSTTEAFLRSAQKPIGPRGSIVYAPSGS